MVPFEIPTYLQKAFSIFKDEFDGNISLLRQRAEQLEETQALDDVDIDSVINLLHKIKGGASFLQLGDIEDTARAAENYAKDTRLGQADAAEKLNSLIAELESHLAKLNTEQ